MSAPVTAQSNNIPSTSQDNVRNLSQINVREVLQIGSVLTEGNDRYEVTGLIFTDTGGSNSTPVARVYMLRDQNGSLFRYTVTAARIQEPNRYLVDFTRNGVESTNVNLVQKSGPNFGLRAHLANYQTATQFLLGISQTSLSDSQRRQLQLLRSIVERISTADPALHGITNSDSIFWIPDASQSSDGGRWVIDRIPVWSRTDTTNWPTMLHNVQAALCTSSISDSLSAALR